MYSYIFRFTFQRNRKNPCPWIILCLRCYVCHHTTRSMVSVFFTLLTRRLILGVPTWVVKTVVSLHKLSYIKNWLHESAICNICNWKADMVWRPTCYDYSADLFSCRVSQWHSDRKLPHIKAREKVWGHSGIDLQMNCIFHLVIYKVRRSESHESRIPKRHKKKDTSHFEAIDYQIGTEYIQYMYFKGKLRNIFLWMIYRKLSTCFENVY